MVTLKALLASPSPILAAAMKMIVEMTPDTRLTAIWWPATGVVPSRAMKIAMKEVG